MASATNSAQTPALMPTARNVAKTRSLEPSGLAVSRSTAGDDDCVQGFDDPWTRRTDELLQIRKLADDWDGLGAEAPSSGIVDSAIDLLKKLKADDKTRDIPVIVLSNGKEYLDIAEKLGASVFLYKLEISIEKIRDALASL